MSGESAIADLFGPPAVQLAVAVEPLPLAALRVVVGATRDVELAVTHQRHDDLREHVETIEAQRDVQILRLETENRNLRRRLATSQNDLESTRYFANLARDERELWHSELELGATALARWARDSPRMPAEVWDAIVLMRRQDRFQ